MNALTPVSDSAAAIAERVIINGDLSKLTPQERVSYYNEVCKSVGLNPLTKPFDYISPNGKLTLYALRACTDQLRTIHNVSVMELVESERDGVFIVTAKVQNGAGRTDASKGAVSISGLKGEALANAMMKAETKAKRRATLSLCGMGWLDESEVDSIPGASKQPQTVTTPQAPALSPPPAPPKAEPKKEKTPQEWAAMALERAQGLTTLADLNEFEEKHGDKIARLEAIVPAEHEEIIDALADRRFVLEGQ